MSKASEWADFVKSNGPRRPYFDSSRIKAEVNEYGDLAHVHVDTVAVPPLEALDFGKWLIDTFSEPHKESSHE